MHKIIIFKVFFFKLMIFNIMVSKHMVAVEWQNYADTGEEQIMFIHHQHGQKCDICDFKVITNPYCF